MHKMKTCNILKPTVWPLFRIHPISSSVKAKKQGITMTRFNKTAVQAKLNRFNYVAIFSF